jgi:hypothetical protein
MGNVKNCGSSCNASGRKALPLVMLAASLAVFIVPLYAVILKLNMDATQFAGFVLATPTSVLMIPGALAVLVVVFTLWHAVRHRARLASLRFWVISLILLQVGAAVAYWTLTLRRNSPLGRSGKRM